MLNASVLETSHLGLDNNSFTSLGFVVVAWNIAGLKDELSILFLSTLLVALSALSLALLTLVNSQHFLGRCLGFNSHRHLHGS